MPVLVDSNVLLDTMDRDSSWHDWSVATIRRLRDETVLIINPIIFAEVSVNYASPEQLEEALPHGDLRRDQLPYSAAFAAGKAFAEYRRRGGSRRSPLPDFYIGAHAEVAGYDLLTRDTRRYRTYFPTVRLIAPDA